MRKTKNTDITAKPGESSLATPSDLRGPLDWFSDLDRWFEDFRSEFEREFWGPLTLMGRESLLEARAPLVDLADDGREFVLTAELPGVKKEDLDIRVTPDVIEIAAEARGEKTEDAKDYYFRERTYQSFQRRLSLPKEVLAEQAEAKMKDGVLEVRLPKKEPTAKHEPIKVRVE